jgi:hypothetical protein
VKSDAALMTAYYDIYYGKTEPKKTGMKHVIDMLPKCLIKVAMKMFLQTAFLHISLICE